MSSSKKYAKGNAFCFTHNNYAEDDIAKLQACDWITYCCVGKEVGKEGTPHLQGYLQVKQNGKTTNTAIAKKLKKVLGKQPAVFIAGGTAKENHVYCSKQAADEKEEEDRFFEWGVPRQGRESQGERTDIKTFFESVAEGCDDTELVERHPKEFAKYYKAGDRLRKAIKHKAGATAMKAAYEDCELRQWQAELVERVEEQNNRQVTWVVDYKGNKGKSWLANWLYVHKDAFIVDGGKQADITHAYDCQEWVVFDLTRTQEEYVNYQVMESFKNGRLFSPKFDSKMKIFKPCKLIVFANWDPDESKLSADRWDIVRLSDKAEETSSASKWDSWDFAAQ